MIALNLVGTTFTHLTGGNKGYSVHGKVSKFVKWVKDGGDATVYMDRYLENAFFDNVQGPKYAWLLESKYITPQIVDKVSMNPRKYIEMFDLIFTHNQELLKHGRPFVWVPAQGFWIREPKIHSKSKFMSMIASNKQMCEGHRERLKWVERLKDKVTLYGRGFNEVEYKEEGLCDYMYSVAIENGCYETYFTEKILDCFATGTIPVYMGAPDIDKHFNKDGIIDLNELTVTHLEQPDYWWTIRYDDCLHEGILEDNLERAKKMEVLEDFIYENYLI